MANAFKCGNCEGEFTPEQIRNGSPPSPPWKLTKKGGGEVPERGFGARPSPVSTMWKQDSHRSLRSVAGSV